MSPHTNNAGFRSRPVLTRPGGRTATVRKAVIEAVLDLLSEGQDRLSVAEVAKRSGVSRSTIHRRWPATIDLVHDAMIEHTGQIRIPNSGSWAQDAEQLLNSLREFCSDPVEVSINAAMVAAPKSPVNQWVIDYWTQRTNQLTTPIHQAIARGELEQETDPIALINLMLGPMVMWSTLTRQPPSKKLTAALLKQILQIGGFGDRSG